MKVGKIIIAAGVCMFVAGLAMFYSIRIGEDDFGLRLVKNIGTFVGLSGMGVTLGGILLFLMDRNEPPIKQNYDA